MFALANRGLCIVVFNLEISDFDLDWFKGCPHHTCEKRGIWGYSTRQFSGFTAKFRDFIRIFLKILIKVPKLCGKSEKNLYKIPKFGGKSKKLAGRISPDTSFFACMSFCKLNKFFHIAAGLHQE